MFRFVLQFLNHFAKPFVKTCDIPFIMVRYSDCAQWLIIYSKCTNCLFIWKIMCADIFRFICLLNYSLLLPTTYEQYLLSRLDNGISPFWYRSASNFRILSHIVFLPLYNALRYGMPFSSVMLTFVMNCVKSSAS